MRSLAVAVVLSTTAIAFAACGDASPSESADTSAIDAGVDGDGAAGPSRDATVFDACDAPCTDAAKRRLAIEVNPLDGAQYAAKVDVAKAAGVSIIPATLPWGGLLETAAPDAGASQIDGFWFTALSDVLHPRKLGLLLSVPLVDTVAVQAPPDLRASLENGTLALDAPEVIARYERILDSYFASTAPQLDLAYLLVSNEADVWLASRPDAAWTALRNFLTSVTAHVHAKRPTTRVGINVTFGGVADPIRAPKIAALVANADAVFVSYYFGANGFGAPVGKDIAKDFGTMLALSKNKPLVLKEHGYPTAVIGHSPEGQAEFVTTTMKVWDTNAAAIPLVVFSRMFDGKRENCEQEAVAYGASGNEEVIRFLCSLGLHSVDGAPKPAWKRFVADSAARGF